MPSIIDKVLRMGEGRVLRKLSNLADQVDRLEPQFQKMSDEELREETPRFRARLAAGETLDSLLPEAFAAVREASVRTLGQRHFHVQLMGGAALHLGNIAEMKTGEGKTLVATTAAYLNALEGKGVHVVTTNDYLAKYQGELMGRVFRFLGMTTGIILTGQEPAERREQYNADITYGTNNEFGFDYLRDNMAWSPEELVQRGHHFAIVDEVDSILIDEARTPLIISGPSQGDANRWYTEFAKLVLKLTRDVDYEVDEKKKTVGILEPGIARIEDYLGIDNLYESLNTPLVGFLNNAIKAKELFKRDKDYVVLNGEVMIVDEHTGRMLPGRRYNEGMHQAIEAKEGVEIKAENQTLATITLQNYFRLYDKLSGMTGTAATEAAEFQNVYKIGVVPIPTNKPMIRVDQPDLVYKNEEGKFASVVEDIAERYKKGQPVLVGTVSVEKSEYLSGLLRRKGVPHKVINAKEHEKEASVVAEAGRLGAVTVATNMAGRGTDIMLGGNAEFHAVQRMEEDGYDSDERPEEYEAAWPQYLADAKAAVAAEHEQVTALGGLYVLGTERHESRRIDNQLRGRSGRQGDPGESRFYLSMQDDLMRLFNSQMAESMMNRAGFPDDMPLESKMVTRGIQSAQTQVEARNAEIRKNVLKYDDVMSRQREVIYDERRQVLDGVDLENQIAVFRDDVIKAYVQGATAEGNPDSWDLEALWTALKSVFPVSITPEDIDMTVGGRAKLTPDALINALILDADRAYDEREEMLGEEAMRQLERRVVLSVLDRKWREHLYEMDYLKEGIGLRAMAQRDPLVEYQREGYQLFSAMTDAIKEESVGYLYHLDVKPAPPEPQIQIELDAGSAAAVAGNSPFGVIASGHSAAADEPDHTEHHDHIEHAIEAYDEDAADGSAAEYDADGHDHDDEHDHDEEYEAEEDDPYATVGETLAAMSGEVTDDNAQVVTRSGGDAFGDPRVRAQIAQKVAEMRASGALLANGPLAQVTTRQPDSVPIKLGKPEGWPGDDLDVVEDREEYEANYYAKQAAAAAGRLSEPTRAPEPEPSPVPEPTAKPMTMAEQIMAEMAAKAAAAAERVVAIGPDEQGIPTVETPEPDLEVRPAESFAAVAGSATAPIIDPKPDDASELSRAARLGNEPSQISETRPSSITPQPKVEPIPDLVKAQVAAATRVVEPEPQAVKPEPQAVEPEPAEPKKPKKDGGAKKGGGRKLHGEATAPEADGETYPGTPRNSQCPCGSGKKYKLCHGKNE